jgi:hypothetical protein
MCSLYRMVVLPAASRPSMTTWRGERGRRHGGPSACAFVTRPRLPPTLSIDHHSPASRAGQSRASRAGGGRRGPSSRAVQNGGPRRWSAARSRWRVPGGGGGEPPRAAVGSGCGMRPARARRRRHSHCGLPPLGRRLHVARQRGRRAGGPAPPSAARGVRGGRPGRWPQSAPRRRAVAGAWKEWGRMGRDGVRGRAACGFDRLRAPPPSTTRASSWTRATRPRPCAGRRRRESCACCYAGRRSPR